MSLMDAYTVECITLVKTRADDPVGGFQTAWEPGVHFNAAWQYESAPELTVAEQQGIGRTYGIFVDPTLDLDYHEAFRRTDNQQVYRVVNPGTDRVTPQNSRINKRLIEVEKWALPNDQAEQG